MQGKQLRADGCIGASHKYIFAWKKGKMLAVLPTGFRAPWFRKPLSQTWHPLLSEPVPPAPGTAGRQPGQATPLACQPRGGSAAQEERYAKYVCFI